MMVFCNKCADSCKWISKDSALNLLLDVNRSCDRVGPLVVIGLLHDSTDSEKWKASQMFHFQVSFLMTY